jgi:pimeloyl-ACP methyl ester carboxylesterase
MTPALRLIGRSLEAMSGPMPRLTGRIVDRLWHTPYPSKRRVEPVGAEREWYETTGGKVHAWRWGTGPTVLMLHGWGSSASRFETLGRAIAETGRSALAIDLPGHGRSYGKRTNVFEVADVAQRVAERQRDPLVGLVGHSFGGFSSLFLAANGIHVPRVISIAAPAEMEDVITIFRQQVAAGPRSEALLRAKITERYGESIADQLHLPTLLATHEDPVLLVHDRGDDEVPFETSQRLAVTVPGAELLLTDGLGHHRIIRDAAVVERMVGFLAI